MDRQLQEWAEEQRELVAPGAVEMALLRELRMRKWRRRAWMMAPLAAAAGFLVLLGNPEPIAVPAPPVAEVAKVSETPKPTVELARAESPKPVVRRAPRRVDPAPEPFIPVGAWQAVEPIERASIVRANVPQATLASYGVAVNPSRWNEPAPVDLLLGEDGTVRAWRVVSTVH
jgi:hypothetical protein